MSIKWLFLLALTINLWRSNSLAVGRYNVKQSISLDHNLVLVKNVCYLNFGHDNQFSTYIFWIFVQTSLCELFKCLAKVSSQLGWIIFWDKKEYSHGMHFWIWRFSFCKFNGCDTKWPNICFGIIRRLFYYLDNIHNKRDCKFILRMVNRIWQMIIHISVPRYTYFGCHPERCSNKCISLWCSIC